MPSLRAGLLLPAVVLPVVQPMPVLLTVQTQIAERMHAIAHAALGQRQLLTFEATQSGIVDVN